MERCVELHDQSESIRNLTNYYWWWPQTASCFKNPSAGFGIIEQLLYPA